MKDYIGNGDGCMKAQPTYILKNLPHHSHNKQQGKDRLLHFITCQREGQTDTLHHHLSEGRTDCYTSSPVRGKDRLIHFIITCQREGQTATLHHLSEGRTD
ncbi:hypothetical protein Pmani_024091 [Petrolisthes manimaculis]|uniref:Uncharacterized protein n=1 Tax=Petrolisthes manimaculis TaxID=1843537 RepID=A0AAE1PB26_9EUCA|nr:hypothetical protein Pmani_024091 [Petrolisthes manimaculis]